MAVVEEIRSFRSPLGEEMMHRQHAMLALLPLEPTIDKLQGSGDREVTAGGTRAGADPYDVAFTLPVGETNAAKLAATAAMEANGGIKLTLEEVRLSIDLRLFCGCFATDYGSILTVTGSQHLGCLPRGGGATMADTCAGRLLGRATGGTG